MSGTRQATELSGSGGEVTIELAPPGGVPPLVFGMSRAEASEAMRGWGEPRDGADTASRSLNVRDDGLTRDVYAHFDEGDRLTSVVIWRPEPGEVHVVVRFRDIDVFGQPADAVLEALRQRGYVVDTSDRYFPLCKDIALGFNREGGEDCDDEGLARHFNSVLTAAPGHYG